MRVLSLGIAVLLLSASGQIATPAQDQVTIRVNAAQKIAPFQPIYAFFGYDEPNYTYTKNGSKLVTALAALTDTPVFLRTHFLLATGDGTPGLKWGSTNAYVEDANGAAVYDWTIVDRIFDTYIHAHAKPFVEIGFMPRALSTKPDPYHSTWIPGAANKDYPAGWAYPPKDYSKWGELVFQLARRNTAGNKPNPGIGKCGTNRIFFTGKGHKKSTSSCTTTPWPLSNAFFQTPASEVLPPQGRRASKRRDS